MEALQQLQQRMTAMNTTLAAVLQKMNEAQIGLTADVQSLKSRITALENAQVDPAEIAALQNLAASMESHVTALNATAGEFTNLDSQTESTPPPTP